MKRSLAIIIMIFSFILLSTGYINIKASDINTTSTNEFVSGDSVLDYNNESIEIDSFSHEYLFFVTGENTSLTIRNLNINVKTKINAIFYVANGGKLILENVTVVTDVIVDYGIINYGKISLNNVNFSAGVISSVVNYSTYENSIELHTVNIKNIYLNSGYVNVFTDTNIFSPIELILGDCYEFEESIGKKLVTGVNTLAKFYINDFYLRNTPARKDYFINNVFNVNNYLLDIENDYYIDFVGDVGSGFVNFTGEAVYTGDIILTKYEIYYSDNSNVYIAGRYCTSDLFLLNTNSLITVTTRYYENNSVKMGSLILNNYTALVGIANYDIVGFCELEEISQAEFIKVDFIIKDNMSLDKLYEKSENIIAGYSNFYAIELPENYISIDSSIGCEIISDIVDYGDYLYFKLSTTKDVSNFNVEILVGENSLNIDKYNLVLENNTFYYTGNSLIDNVLVYYMVEDEKVYLTNEDFVINKLGNESDFINVGEYELVVTKVPAGVEFDSLEFSLCILSKDISLSVEGEYIYNGNDQKEDIKIYYTFEDKVYLDSDDFIIKKNGEISDFKNAGDYEVVIIKNFDNFNLQANTLNITMKKKIIDTENDVVFEDKIVEYDGNAHKILLSGVDENLIRIDYSNNAFVNASDEPYKIIATLTLVDVLNYELTKDEFVAYLRVLKADVNVSGVTFSDITKVYDGMSTEITIDGNIPSFVSVKYEYYLNDDLMSDMPINVGIYKVIAKYNISIDNMFNYNSISNMIAYIEIKPQIIDCSNVVFTNKTYDYNNTNQFIYADNLPKNVVCKYSYTSTGEVFDGVREVGVYEIKLQLLPINENFILINNETKTAILTIEKLSIDSDDIKFNDVEFVYDGLVHSPEIIGTLPEGVAVSFEYEHNPNVGEYVAYAHFISNDENILAPASKVCKIIIKPRPVVVDYKNYYTVGSNKYFELEFSGILNNDKIIANIIYSMDINKPIANINLDIFISGNSNYTISNNHISDNFNYSDEAVFKKLSTNFKYEINAKNNTIKFSEENSLEINRAIEKLNLDIKNYNVLKSKNTIGGKYLTIKLTDNNSYKYFKAYAFDGNKLTELEFTKTCSEIIIVCDDYNSIVFTELDNNLIRNIIIMILFMVLSLAIISFVMVQIVIMYKRDKK